MYFLLDSTTQSFLVLWFLLLSACNRFRNDVNSLVHESTPLPSATRSVALDTSKAASQFAVIMEVNIDISSSVSVDCLTF